MTEIITLISVGSKKEFQKRLDEIRGRHIVANPNKEILVEVLNPNPDGVTFNESFAKQFTVGVTIKNYEENE